MPEGRYACWRNRRSPPPPELVSPSTEIASLSRQYAKERSVQWYRSLSGDPFQRTTSVTRMLCAVLASRLQT